MLVCTKAGYVPGSIRLTSDKAYDLALSRGGTASLICTTVDGAPVESCRIAMGIGSVLATLCPDDGLGVPSSTRPAWSAMTDAEGRAEFSGVPRGEYRIDVSHPLYHAYRLDPATMRVPGPAVHVTLRPLWGIAFVAPVPRSIVAYRIKVSGADSRGAFFSSSHASREFEHHHSGSIVRVGLPTGSERPTAEAVACLDNGLLLGGFGSMHPLDQHREPVVLDQLTPVRPVSEVTVRTFFGGQEVRGVPLELGTREFRLSWWHAESGKSFKLPAGEYGVGVGFHAEPLRHWQDEETFTVGANRVSESTTMTIRLDFPVSAGWVNVVPKTPHGAVETPMGVTVRPSQGSSFVVANWYSGCKRDPLRFLLPAGPTIMSAGARGYGVAEVAFVVTEGEQNVILAMPYSH